MNPWRKIKENIIYENKYGYRLREDDVITPKGTTGKYMVLESRGYVSVVALTPEKQVIMVKQWRYPIEEESLEIPAGGIENNDDPIETAKRELNEEVGVSGGNYKVINEYWLGNGALKIKGYVVLATDVKVNGISKQEDTEMIETILLPFEKVVEEVLKGNITDIRTISGILITKEYLKH